jgi:hypothetical protein
MVDDEKRVTPAQLGAFGVGLTVTIASAVLTSPIAPLNILISLVLGSAAGYGALKVFDPRTRQDVLEVQSNAEYRQTLQEIEKIAVRTGEASRSLRLISTEISGRLGRIARMIEMVLDRYQARPRYYAGASTMLLMLQRFDELLVHYLKVKRGELFLDQAQRQKEIQETEMLVIPMFETALENLGKRLDAGEALDTGISQGTLESMLRSLNLIESVSDQIASSSAKGDPQ